MAEQIVELKDVMEAVTDLREKHKKYGEDSEEFRVAQTKTEEILEKHEKWNQKLVGEMAEERKKREETEERVKALELELANAKTMDPKNYKESAEYKALNKFCKYGMNPQQLTPEEIKELRTDNDTQGGYLTHTELDNQIIKQITEISPVRQVSRVRTTSQKSLEIPVRTGIPTATYEGETEAVGDTNSTYGNETLTPVRLSVSVPYTMDLLMDSNFDLEGEIKGDVAEAMAQKEGNKFVLGTGHKQPEGFTVNAEVVANHTYTSAASGVVDATDLTMITGELKVGYNPMYGFNRKTLAYFRTLEDSAGRPIWQINLADNAPAQINGEVYVLFQDMADIAANSISVVYADFMRGYTITDKNGLVIVRDEYSLKKQAMIEMTFHKWNYGQVVLPEAFQLLKTKA